MPIPFIVSGVILLLSLFDTKIFSNKNRCFIFVLSMLIVLSYFCGTVYFSSISFNIFEVVAIALGMVYLLVKSSLTFSVIFKLLFLLTVYYFLVNCLIVIEDYVVIVSLLVLFMMAFSSYNSFPQTTLFVLIGVLILNGVIGSTIISQSTFFEIELKFVFEVFVVYFCCFVLYVVINNTKGGIVYGQKNCINFNFSTDSFVFKSIA